MTTPTPDPLSLGAAVDDAFYVVVESHLDERDPGRGQEPHGDVPRSQEPATAVQAAILKAAEQIQAPGESAGQIAARVNGFEVNGTRVGVTLGRAGWPCRKRSGTSALWLPKG